MTEALSSFAEIRALLAELPGRNEEAVAAAAERESQLTKPGGSLGRLEEISSWLAAWSHKGVAAEHPRVAVFAGNHGVTKRGVSAFPAEVTHQMVANFVNGGAAVNQLCQAADADLRVYELDLDNPTDDMSAGPAMDEARCVEAMAYGMMAVEPEIDLLCLGEMGIGNTTAAAAISHGLFGGKAADWTGRGTGVDDTALANKTTVVAEAVATNTALLDDPLHLMRALGGLELAAMAGAILAARLARVPVLLDGYVVTAAAAPLYRLDPSLLDHCLVAHTSVEPGHQRLCDAIGKAPLLNLGMRLGEGSGAALAISIVKAAAACHTGMATFAEAAVSGKAES